MMTFFTRISTKCTNFEVSTLGLELQVSSLGLGVFDGVSVSSRNFNQVSVSVSKVTVSTTSVMRKWQSFNGFTCEKAKALPISLAKVPTLHRVAVGRNLELWWRYEGGPML